MHEQHELMLSACLVAADCVDTETLQSLSVSTSQPLSTEHRQHVNTLTHPLIPSPPVPSPLLEVGPLKSSGVWGGAPAEIEFGAFWCELTSQHVNSHYTTEREREREREEGEIDTAFLSYWASLQETFP